MSTEDRDKLTLQLMRAEGVRLKPYADTVGKITIGCGRNLTDCGISADEADFLLQNDIDRTIKDCLTFPWFVTMDAIRQRAVVDLVFNMGLSVFKTFKNTIAALAVQDYPKAAAHLRKSQWYGQVKTRGPRVVGMIETGREPL